jgi:hypothetical protein
MNSTTATPCTLQSILYLENVTEYWTVGVDGQPDNVARRGNSTGDSDCYECNACYLVFASWQAALSHIQTSGSNEETAR